MEFFACLHAENRRGAVRPRPAGRLRCFALARSKFWVAMATHFRTVEWRAVRGTNVTA
eukprot:COSAG01_NODE_2301_length_7953_cov_4.000127_1_plen_58_part_00